MYDRAQNGGITSSTGVKHAGVTLVGRNTIGDPRLEVSGLDVWWRMVKGAATCERNRGPWQVRLWKWCDGEGEVLLVCGLGDMMGRMVCWWG